MAIEQIIHENIYFFPYLECFVIFQLLQYLFEFYLNFRQIKCYKIKERTPEIIKLNVSDEQFKKSQDYSFDKLSFGMMMTSSKFAFDLILLFLYYSAYLWNKTTSVFPFISADNEFQRGLAFFFLETIKGFLIDLPFTIYKHFVLEERYGFNKLTLKTFIKDNLLELLIMSIITPILLYCYLYLVENGGPYFFVYVEIMMIIFIFLMIWIYPNFIAPLFNTFKELEDGELKTNINELAHSINFPLKKIYVMDGSKRTAHSNAYFFGFGSNKRIVLFDTLLNQLSTQEIVAVLGHELGHWKMKHMPKQLFISICKIFVIFYIFSFYLNEKELFLSYGFHEKSIIVGTMLFLNMFSPISYVLELISLKITRMFEFQADYFACKLKKGTELKSGLVKLFTENSSGLISDPLYAACTYTHPTLLERLDFISRKENELFSEKKEE